MKRFADAGLFFCFVMITTPSINYISRPDFGILDRNQQ